MEEANKATREMITEIGIARIATQNRDREILTKSVPDAKRLTIMLKVVGDDLAHVRAGTPNITHQQKGVYGALMVLPTGPISVLPMCRSKIL